MTMNEIITLLEARQLCGAPQQELDFTKAFAGDMMSDVLACVTEDTLLLTGMVNSQCVRTCEMLDVPCVIFVRSKEPLADALALAREIGLPMLKTPYTMFESCARLYTAGLKPVELG